MCAMSVIGGDLAAVVFCVVEISIKAVRSTDLRPSELILREYRVFLGSPQHHSIFVGLLLMSVFLCHQYFDDILLKHFSLQIMHYIFTLLS